MEGRFYPSVFEARGIAVVAPEAADRAYIHEKYMGELVSGIIRPETREGLMSAARRLRDRHHVDAIVLGGTELPLTRWSGLRPSRVAADQRPGSGSAIRNGPSSVVIITSVDCTSDVVPSASRSPALSALRTPVGA